MVKRLHIGCGKRQFPGWIHIDGADFPHIDHHDITKLPFQDNSVSEIYACHVLEYGSKVEGEQWLKEWRRVLEPGGIMRIAVPDFDSCLQVYLRGATINKILGLLYGEMEMGSGNKIYHKTAYNYSSLTALLENLGFKDIDEYDWRETEFAKIDDHSHAHYPHSERHIKDQSWDSTFTLMSLNIQCRK